MARKADRYDYAPDGYQPVSNALGCPFTVAALGTLALIALVAGVGLVLVGLWLMVG